MEGITLCIYCRKSLSAGSGSALVDITAWDGGPRIGRAHPDCVAIAAGLDPAWASTASTD